MSFLTPRLSLSLLGALGKGRTSTSCAGMGAGQRPAAERCAAGWWFVLLQLAWIVTCSQTWPITVLFKDFCPFYRLLQSPLSMCVGKVLADQLTSFCLDLCCLSLMSWCGVWHPIHGSLSWLPAYPGASYAETSLPENSVGLLVFITPTDVHCDFMYANFPLPPPSLRRLLPSRSPGVQAGLCFCQIAIQIFSSFPATKELQPLNTPLLARVPEQNTSTCLCTCQSAHWNCSWKEGCLVTLSKAVERLWILLLKREDNQFFSFWC